MQERSWIEINLDNYIHNLKQIRKNILPHQNIMQIVKADAYGHGAVKISETALENGVSMLGVANSEEGTLLRYTGLICENNLKNHALNLSNCPILILSPSLPEEIDNIIEYNLTPSVSQLEFCEKLNTAAKNRDIIYPVHIKIDTGMNRNGVRIDDIKEFLQKFKSFKNLYIEGVFSHYSESESQNDTSEKQILAFDKIISLFDNPKYIHIANSAGILFHNYKKANMLRLGFLSYGVNQNARVASTVELKPVMSIKSKIVHISYALKGESIGYNSTFKADKNINYAIIPIGYADGYDFLLSNKSFVQIQESLCRVLGRVSMDMLCVDISNLKTVSLYDEVLLMGEGRPEINASELASLYNGSAYELLCQIGRRAKRFYLLNSKTIDEEPVQKRSFIPTDFNTDKLSSIIKQSIAHRIQNSEFASVVYEDILRYFFIDSDREINYRTNFNHTIEFLNHPEHPDFYLVKTYLSYNKILQDNYFHIGCASDEDSLKYFFKMKNCEYRWLLDEKIAENFCFSNSETNQLSNFFELNRVMINDIKMNIEVQEVQNQNLQNKTLLFKLLHTEINTLKNKLVTFKIETQTLYPKKSHQLSVYLYEITKGVEVSFSFPDKLKPVEITTIFSGKERFPETVYSENKITVKTKPDTWIFPNSGIVFSY